MKSKYYNGQHSWRYPYGVCTVRVNRVDIAQMLYGGIKESIGDESDRWIDIRKRIAG